MIQKDLRVGVFVDAANVHISASSTFNGRRIDYEKLLNLALTDPLDPKVKYNLCRALVYAVRHSSADDDLETTKKKMYKWETALSYMGYEVKTKDVVHYGDGRSKADWDIQITIDIVRMIDMIDMVVLISGDGDFLPLVNWCQGKGRVVRVISVEPNTNRKLKETADVFTPIVDTVLQPPRDRKESKPAATTEKKKFGEGLVPTPEEREKLDREIEEFEAQRQE